MMTLLTTHDQKRNPLFKSGAEQIGGKYILLFVSFVLVCFMASGDLKISSTSLSTCEETCRIHLLPCELEHDGHAKVGAYFMSSVREEGTSTGSDGSSKEFSASLRGRGLKGSQFQLPAGYTGYVLKEDKRPLNDEEDREMKACHKFSQFTYWNLETPPSQNDAVIKAMQWIDIAAALHGSKDDINQNNTPEDIR